MHCNSLLMMTMRLLLLLLLLPGVCEGLKANIASASQGETEPVIFKARCGCSICIATSQFQDSFSYCNVGISLQR
jgi:hypothetical protein